MATVSDILAYLEKLAPSSMKMDWDNVGLLCGSGGAPVTRILVALDPFEHVCQEASDIGADLIVSHHPLIFRPLASITDASAITRGIMLLCQKGISAINAHTNLDCAPGGVNDVLAETLGLSQVEVVNPSGVDGQGRPWGLLRCGYVQEQNLEHFLQSVKKKLGTPVLRYAEGGKPVHKVAVGGGACAGALHEAIAAGCDTFVTSDIKYNDFWEAKERGLNLIDAGHFYTENPVCAVLAKELQAAFPEISVVLSQNHKDAMKFF